MGKYTYKSFIIDRNYKEEPYFIRKPPGQPDGIKLLKEPPHTMYCAHL